MESEGIKNESIKQEVYENLPPVLKKLTDGFLGREKDIVLLSSIGVLSCCLPNFRCSYGGKDYNANLYLIIIAPPASGKGVMNYSRKLIEPIHDNIVSESRAEIKRIKEKAKEDKVIPPDPQLEVKILPANISSAKMYAYLGASKHGLLIIESEADTLGNMLKNEWSDISDVLRKVAQHEPVSISRKIDDLFLEIKEPKLSMVMTGTPNQLKPIVKSKEDGLFSRFAMYIFDDIDNFKNMFNPLLANHNEVFIEVSKEVLSRYQAMSTVQEIKLEFTEGQITKFFEKFEHLHDDIKNNRSQSFLPNLKRHALIFIRISMVLTSLRENDINTQIWKCSDSDFETALEITVTLLKHALVVHNTIDDGFLSQADDEFLFGLGNQFTRQRAIEFGEKLSIPQRTVDDKLVQWRKKKLIKKIKHGLYRRTAN